jgi:hypothetical protein
MLTTIKGYYHHGQIILRETPLVKTKTVVMVTFLTEENTAKEVKENWEDWKGK